MSGDICVHPSEQRRAAQAGCVWLLRGCGRGRKHQARDEGLCQQKAQQRQGFIDSHKERPVLEEEVPLLAMQALPMALPREPSSRGCVQSRPHTCPGAGLSNQSLASLGRTSCHSPRITPLALLGSQASGHVGTRRPAQGALSQPACGRGAWKWGAAKGAVCRGPLLRYKGPKAGPRAASPELCSSANPSDVLSPREGIDPSPGPSA